MSRLHLMGLVGLLVVVAGPVAATAAPVQDVVAKGAAILGNMHKKASSALVIVAQDPAFAAIFAAIDEPTRSKIKERVDQISLKTQENFQIGEMCLIGVDGAERSRIVGRQIATDLDADEANNEFFSSTLKAKPRTVYIPKIYLSADTGSWVVAYATPISLNGANVGLLHYEHRLDEYQRALDGGVKGTTVHLMAVDETGHVIVDSADEPSALAKKDKDADAYFKVFSLGASDMAALRSRLGGMTAGHGQIGNGAAKLDVAYQEVQGWTLVGVQSAGDDLADRRDKVHD